MYIYICVYIYICMYVCMCVCVCVCVCACTTVNHGTTRLSCSCIFDATSAALPPPLPARVKGGQTMALTLPHVQLKKAARQAAAPTVAMGCQRRVFPSRFVLVLQHLLVPPLDNRPALRLPPHGSGCPALRLALTLFRICLRQSRGEGSQPRKRETQPKKVGAEWLVGGGAICTGRRKQEESGMYFLSFPEISLATVQGD